MSGFDGYDQWKTASPYDDVDEIRDNTDFEEQFSDYNSLSDLYRSVYKYTACGPTLGVTCWGVSAPANDVDAGPNSICYDQEGPITYYGDDLRKFGSFADMREQGVFIMELFVSSIVEGVDNCTETYAVEWTPIDTEPKELYEQFWKAVEDCDNEANSIWNETHGCPGCFDYPADWDDLRPVDEECQSCGGLGICI